MSASQAKTRSIVNPVALPQIPTLPAPTLTPESAHSRSSGKRTKLL
ncbi:MAG: hypothetical protein J0L70_28815 [Leptolyngbya sp. UWPOB_LEPTO1]|nr:hypothetical protein [Leptolyngbya sp. UWPOB_LEPTO1]